MKLRLLNIFLVVTSLIIIGGNATAQHFTQEVDSLINLSYTAPDTVRARLNNEIAWKLRNYKPELAIQYSMRGIDYAMKFDNHMELVKGYSFTGVCHRNLGNYSDALEYYQLGLDAANQFGIKEQEAYAYINLGNIFLYQEKYTEAESKLINALAIAKEIQDSSILSYVYLNIGRAYLGQKNFKNAEEHLNQALKIRQESHAPVLQCVVATKYIGDVYTDKGDYETAKKIYYTCLNNEAVNTDCDLVADMTNKLSYIYYNSKMYDSALYFGKESLDFAKMVGTKYRIKNAYNAIADVYYAEKNYKEAATNYYNQIIINDSIFNEQLTQKLFNIQFSAEQYKKQAEIDKMKIEAKNTFLVIGILVIILLAGLIQAIILIRNNRKVNRLNLQIQAKNDELSRRSEELANKQEELVQQNQYIEDQRLSLLEQQRQINDSISYAQRIQTAILPDINNFGTFFSDRFVFYKPRDVVSGDFYWHFDDDTHEIIAIADCTGHGVPGACMSMLGTSSLHEIINDKDRDTSVILNRLRTMIKNLLHQTNEECTPKDGMDMALIVVNKKTMELQYSGANIPMVYIRNNETFVLTPNRNPIGIFIREQPFDAKTLQLQKGDCIYMSSDGYCSQFGGPNRIKFKIGSYRDMLLKIHELPMSEQQKIVEQNFIEWKGKNKQIDDILVAGFRV